MRKKTDNRISVRLRRADLWLLGGTAAAALALWLGLTFLSPHGACAVVTAEGREVLRLPLNRDCTETVETPFGTHTVVVEGGSVRISEAPCPNQVCVHHAPVSHAGETVVCLPCRVVVTVVSDGGTLLTDEAGEVLP